MKTIQLNPLDQNLFAQVDDADYERVRSIEWSAMQSNATWYAIGHVPKRGSLLLHRYLLDAPPGMVVDHKKPHRGSAALFWSEGNLQVLCASPCHSKHKQTLERAEP